VTIDSKYLPAFDGWLRTMGEDVLSLANLLETSDAPLPFRQASAQALQYLLRSTELIPEGLEALGYLEGAFAFRVIAQHALDDGPGELSGDDSTDGGSREEGSRDERPVDGPTGDDLTDDGLTDDGLTDDGLTDDGLGDDPTDDGFAADRFGHGLTDDDRADPDPPDEGATDDRPRDDGSAQAGAPDDGHRAGSGRVDRVELTEGRVPRLAADVELIREFLEDDMPRLLELTLAPAATSRAGRSAADVLEDAALRGVTLRDARQWVERYRAPELRASEQELVKLRSFFRTRLRREHAERAVDV
jgi:hypothetical protein